MIFAFPMKTLITPLQVLELAFGDEAYLPPQHVAEADIAAAEERHIVPVIGRALHAKLLDGGYPELVADYLAAPAALFTRLAIQPRLDIRTDRCGTTAPKSSWSQPAAAEARQALLRSLRTTARALLRRASEHLRETRRSYPEYDPDCDITCRCTTDGAFVQIR